MSDILTVLEEQEWLAGVEVHKLDRVAKLASEVTFEGSQYIFREGEEANHFYLLTRGQVALEMRSADRMARMVQTLHEGDLLGWSWLFAPQRWHFDARAITLTRAIEFSGPRVRALCDEDHDLGYALMSRFALIIMRRLQATRLQLMDVYGPPR